MEIQTNGGADFKALGAKFRAAGKDGAAIRRATTKRIQARLAVIVDEQKSMAVGMHVKGTRGGGSKRRAGAVSAAAMRKGRKVRARRGGYGLRSTIASAIKSKVSYSGFKLGARITVGAARLPQSQRKLPRYLNSSKGWRHPVWGNRKNWVQQFGEPYFDEPIARHRDRIRREIAQEVNDVMRTLK